jgi:predicted DNA-binding protein
MDTIVLVKGAKMKNKLELSEKTMDMLDYLCGNDAIAKMELIDELVENKLFDYEDFKMLDNEGHFPCRHRHLTLQDNGSYTCDVCGAKINVEIEF